MNELVQIIMQKTGLSQDQSQEIVNTVVTHCKAKLPEALSGHFDGILAELQSPAAAGMFEKAKAYAATMMSKPGTTNS